MYTIQHFSLLRDTIITRHTRRCVRPRYDKKGEYYPVESMDNLPIIVTDLLNERMVSPLAKSYRAPNLNIEHWLKQEDYHTSKKYLEGCVIQIFSIMTAVGIKTTYNIQYTDNSRKRWKRIIASFHVSEGSPFTPHVVREFEIEEN